MYAKYYNKLCGSKGVPFYFFEELNEKKNQRRFF